MPIARFQMPDGRVARFEVPEGTSPEQAQSMMEAHFAAPEQPKIVVPEQSKAAAPAGEIPVGRTASWGDVITGAPYKGLAGAADVVLNAPYNIANLAKMGYGAATTALGRPDLAPNVEAPPDFVQSGLRNIGLIKETPNMTPAQRAVDVGLQAATSGVINPAASMRQVAANVAKGGLAGLAGQTTTEVTGSPLAGLAVSMATPSALESRARSQQNALALQKSKNTVRDETLQAAQKEGFMVTPGSVSPSVQNVMFERIGGKTRVEQGMSIHNQQVVDKLARRAVNLPEDAPLTPQTMQQVRADEYAKGYAPVAAIGPVQTDATFAQAMQDVVNKFTGKAKSFPGAAPDEVGKLVANYSVPGFDAADAIDAMRTLRETAKGSFTKGDTGLGKAQVAVAKSLEDQIERSLIAANNPQANQLLQQFRDSRTRMAISHSIEDAIHVGGGSVDATKLASDIQKGKLLTGDLEVAAKFANTFKNVNKSPATMGTPGAGTVLGATGAGLGALISSSATGAALGALAPAAASAAARRYIQSGLAQRRALPNYEVGQFLAQDIMNPQLRNALIGIPMTANQNALAPR